MILTLDRVRLIPESTMQKTINGAARNALDFLLNFINSTYWH